MPLPDDIAVLLREALSESENADNAEDAYGILAYVVGNLLPPAPIEPDQGQPAGLFNAYLASGDEADLPF